MAKIIIDVPEEIEREAKILKIELALLLQRALKDQIEKIRKIERIRKIVAKSQATEEDAEEIANEIKGAVWKHYSKILASLL